MGRKDFFLKTEAKNSYESAPNRSGQAEARTIRSLLLLFSKKTFFLRQSSPLPPGESGRPPFAERRNALPEVACRARLALGHALGP